METLLKHRKNLKNEAQKHFFEAQTGANEALNKIESMYKKIDELRLQVEELTQQGGELAKDVVQIYEFIELQKLKIEMKKVEARELLSVAEEKKELLIEATRDHKIILKLKEKRKAEHLLKIKKQEQKKLDENSIIRFNHRSMGK